MDNAEQGFDSHRVRGSLVHDGALRTVYERIGASPDATAFRAAQQQGRISDVLELTWMITGVLELRSVRQMLEKVSSAALPGPP